MVTTIKRYYVATLAVILCGVFVSYANAQSSTKNEGFGASATNYLRNRNSVSRFSVSNIQASVRNRSVASVGTIGVNRRNYLSSSNQRSPRTKPFTSLTKGPTVSPYLALSAPRSSASDYYNIIRPQQQAQRDNRRAQIQAIQQQRRLNQLAARAPYSSTGDENSAPTGHVAVFQSLGSYQNTGNYFPPPSAPKQR